MLDWIEWLEKIDTYSMYYCFTKIINFENHIVYLVHKNILAGPTASSHCLKMNKLC